ncbi:PPOX class F420-dependent oxidoreductase [Actinokineospora guangxiensis]|uniref:PPOX class F420-dependent oxidoreductase n=1 Tax=Actinokineospora guangxiensis TaxID=1490288 RepID=A0ABW0ESQ0_9PSEU
MSDLDRLGAGKYVLVTTRRRDGRTVPTPVWAVRDGEELLIWTPKDSGKVKRIRNFPDVELAECDFRGNPSGPSVPATARILDAAGAERARKLISRKYGVMGKLTVLGSKLRRGAKGTVGISLRVD